MAPDSSKDTTSEWLERTLMLAGVALFFTALLIAGPLSGALGVLDLPDGDSAATDDPNNSSETPPEAAVSVNANESGDASENTERTDGGAADASGDRDQETEERDGDGESDEEEEEEEERSEDDASSRDEDTEEDGGPGEGKAKGHEKDNGNGNGKAKGKE